MRPERAVGSLRRPPAETYGLHALVKAACRYRHHGRHHLRKVGDRQVELSTGYRLEVRGRRKHLRLTERVPGIDE